MPTRNSPGTDDWRLRHQPFGAQLMSAIAGGKGRFCEILFASGRSLGPLSPVRGGVPVMFPQFNELGPLPKHGLVRTATWQEAASHASTPSADGAAYQLSLDQSLDPRWPHAARLTLDVQAAQGTLEITLSVLNIGNSAFDWTGGLHPYFSVVDSLSATLSGLEGCELQDRYDVCAKTERARSLSWTGEAFERLYAAAPPLMLDAGSHRLKLSCSGFDQWMVWNPGRELAQSIADLAPEDWRRFVCIEPVVVSRPNRLLPGEAFAGRLCIELLPD